MGTLGLITNLGLAKIAQAAAGGASVKLTSFKISDKKLAEFSLTAELTAMVGNVVYPTPADVAKIPTQLSVNYVNSRMVTYRIMLDDTIGDFTMGSVGLFTDDNQLFAMIASDDFGQKTKTVGASRGNVRLLEAPLYLIGQPQVINISGNTIDDGNMPRVDNETKLPSASTAPFNTYILSVHTKTGKPAIASRDKEGTGWFYIALTEDPTEVGDVIGPSKFNSAVTPGQTVYFNSATQKYEKGDSSNLSRFPSGVRGKAHDLITKGLFTFPGTITIDGLVSNTLTLGARYYAAGGSQAGHLTVVPNQSYVGQAVGTKTLNIDISSNPSLYHDYLQQFINMNGTSNYLLLRKPVSPNALRVMMRYPTGIPALPIYNRPLIPNEEYTVDYGPSTATLRMRIADPGSSARLEIQYLGDVPFNATEVPNNSVSETKIVNRSVTRYKIGLKELYTEHFNDNQIPEAAYGDTSVSNRVLANASITAPKITNTLADIIALHNKITQVQISTSNPVAAPAFIGQRWINTALKTAFVAVGVADVSDWISDGDRYSVVTAIDVSVKVADLNSAVNSGQVYVVPVGAGLFKIRDIIRTGVGVQFDAGGDRLVRITDGTRIWSEFPKVALVAAPTPARWGGTNFAWPVTPAHMAATSGVNGIYFKYTGGTTNYSAGELNFVVLLDRIS